MRFGHGVSHGAVSILNAIPCGIGASVGVNLMTQAMFAENGETIVELVDRPGLDDALARRCVEKTLKRIGKSPTGYMLRVWSDIPPSVGLKSSSSVCNAVISAVLDYYDVIWNPMDVITTGVECSKECNVTVTGAFDDACCCMFGGEVVADNNKNELISVDRIQEFDVVILVPETTIEKKDIDVEKYKGLSNVYAEFGRCLEKFDFDVMQENGKRIADIAGCDLPDPKKYNALASGVSGTGPATFLVAKKGKGKSIAKKIKGNTIVTTTRSCISFSSGTVKGTVDVPPSKSYTHRAIFMAALSGKQCIIRDPLFCDDTRSSMDAVASIGAGVTVNRTNIIIKGGSLHAPKETIDVGNSGTTLRFMTAVVSLFPDETEITGDESICGRTVGPLVEALGIDSQPRPPLTIKGPIKKSRITVDGSDSSQFVSAALMVSPLLNREIDVTVKGKSVSQPYIRMTVEMMKRFGIEINKKRNTYHVSPGSYGSFDFTVPKDYSAAAYPLVAGGLAGKVTVRGLDPEDIQGDKQILDILAHAGCKISSDNDGITCEHAGRPKAVDVDMKDCPDLFPIVAVLLSVADGTSRLHGAPHLRLKESDRIFSTVRMLRSLGADVSATEDGCVINGVERLNGGRVDHNGDHRIMMAAAVASLACRGRVYMDDDGCWNVSYPEFVKMMDSLKVERCSLQVGNSR